MHIQELSVCQFHLWLYECERNIPEFEDDTFDHFCQGFSTTVRHLTGEGNTINRRWGYGAGHCFTHVLGLYLPKSHTSWWYWPPESVWANKRDTCKLTSGCRYHRLYLANLSNPIKWHGQDNYAEVQDELQNLKERWFKWLNVSLLLAQGKLVCVKRAYFICDNTRLKDAQHRQWKQHTDP